MKTRLDCPCGEHIEAENEEDLVEKAMEHLKAEHADIAERYEREHILFMAY